MGIAKTPNCRTSPVVGVWAEVFPPFLPKEMEKIKDPFARRLASRIERLPVEVNTPYLSIFFLVRIRFDF